MRKTILVSIASWLVILGLTGCDDEQRQVEQVPQVTQPSTVVVQGGNDSGVGDFMMGAVVGGAISNMANSSNNRSRTTIINNNVAPRNNVVSKSHNFYTGDGKQVYVSKPSRPAITTNKSYTTNKSSVSPLSSYNKPSRSFTKSKSYSSTRRR